MNKNIKQKGRDQIELPLWRTNKKTSPQNKFLLLYFSINLQMTIF